MKRGAAVWLTMLLALVVTVPAGAQDDERIQILQTTETANGAVELEIAIPPAMGEVAPVASNFAVAVDGDTLPFVLDPIQSAVDVLVVIDTSGSMSGEAIESARAAGIQFIDSLPEQARVGVIGFGPTAELLAPIGTDRDAARSALQSLTASGETALWDALTLASDTFTELDVERPYVVVLSDGDDTVSEGTFDDAVASMTRADAGLYAISIQTGDSQPANLEGAVDEVGGQFLATSDLGGLSDLYQQIAGRLTSRYLLRFQPPVSTETTAIVSVAVDGAVATARTTIGSGTAVAAAAADADVPRSLNSDVPPELASGFVGEGAGALGGSMALLLGIAAIFGALLLIGFNLASPTTSIQAIAAAGRRAPSAKDVNSSVTDAADRFIAARDESGGLDASLDAAGINLRPGEFVLMGLVGSVLVGLFFSVLGGPVIGIAMLAIAVVGIWLWVTIKTGRQRKMFADQLPDALNILTGSLKAGRGLPQAIELVAQEAAPPLSDQFQRVVFETRVGRDLTRSIETVADRMKNQDLHWVARAIDINRELGGDLVEVLDNVNDTIRDRRRVARQVRALSAEGRASGWVLIVLPFLMFAFLAWRTPENAQLMLEHPTGRVMLGLALLGIFLGYLWIRKLVDLKY